jgi:phosphoserine aminotransferase
MAGVELDWQSADIWFASVQKCFGFGFGNFLGVIFFCTILVKVQLLIMFRNYAI